MFKYFNLFFLCFAFVASLHGDDARFVQTPEDVKSAQYGHIDAKGLKALIESNIPFTLIDARTRPVGDKNVIIGSKFARASDTDEYIFSVIPNLNELIVVHCYSYSCPYAGSLAHRLLDLGYTNIIEYSGGLREWRDIAFYPIEVITD